MGATSYPRSPDSPVRQAPRPEPRLLPAEPLVQRLAAREHPPFPCFRPACPASSLPGSTFMPMPTPCPSAVVRSIWEACWREPSIRARSKAVRYVGRGRVEPGAGTPAHHAAQRFVIQLAEGPPGRSLRKRGASRGGKPGPEGGALHFPGEQLLVHFISWVVLWPSGGASPGWRDQASGVTAGSLPGRGPVRRGAVRTHRVIPRCCRPSRPFPSGRPSASATHPSFAVSSPDSGRGRRDGMGSLE